MGSGRWDSGDWTATRGAYTKAAKPSVDHIYTKRSIDPRMDPSKLKLRESRDSAANPNSTPLIVALDVTGSMGTLLDYIAREGLGQLVGSIYDRQPISDPHIMVMGIGDFEHDSAPLQATQFEAENKPLVEQMENIYLERGGGGNHYESYAAAWLFAATRTSIDSFEKRGKKGYLFTVGDEQPTPKLFGADVARFLGGEQQEDLDGAQLLAMASATYEVFHVVVMEGNHYRTYPDRTRKAWVDLMGQRALFLPDHKKLAELIVSAIQVAEGADSDTVAASWSGDTALVVGAAISGINPVAKTTMVGGMKLLD